MRTPLHDHERQALERAEYQAALVAFRACAGKVRDFRKVQVLLDLQLVNEGLKPASKHHQDGRLEGCLCLDELDRLFDPV